MRTNKLVGSHDWIEYHILNKLCDLKKERACDPQGVIRQFSFLGDIILTYRYVRIGGAYEFRDTPMKVNSANPGYNGDRHERKSTTSRAIRRQKRQTDRLSSPFFERLMAFLRDGWSSPLVN